VFDVMRIDEAVMTAARKPAAGVARLQRLSQAIIELAAAVAVVASERFRGHAYPVEFGTHYILCFVCTMIVSALRKAGSGQKRRFNRKVYSSMVSGHFIEVNLIFGSTVHKAPDSCYAMIICPEV
jgi:hypothetical protein